MQLIQQKQTWVEGFRNKYPKVITQYLRRGDGQLIGLMIAFVHEGKIKFGWSKCNFKEGDRFDKKLAFYFAARRAMRSDDSAKPLPRKLVSSMGKFMSRANNYFKDRDELKKSNKAAKKKSKK